MWLLTELHATNVSEYGHFDLTLRFERGEDVYIVQCPADNRSAHFHEYPADVRTLADVTCMQWGVIADILPAKFNG